MVLFVLLALGFALLALALGALVCLGFVDGLRNASNDNPTKWPITPALQMLNEAPWTSSL